MNWYEFSPEDEYGATPDDWYGLTLGPTAVIVYVGVPVGCYLPGAAAGGVETFQSGASAYLPGTVAGGVSK